STMKVDSLFIKQIEANRPQILNAIMALAHELKLETITEGIETAAQLRYVQHRGSTLAQGLFFSGPLPEKQAFQLLINDQSWDVKTVESSNLELRDGVAAG
ncbi:MAG: EAL domain-containing protein, partial [Acidobacteriaceae bacterium]|nr:EAL domain-containing protein [Acidobacteriaceae bacterium]